MASSTGSSPAAAPGEASAPSFRSVLALREYRGLWLAQITSLVGDQLAKLAIAILIFRQSHSPLLAAVSYAVSYLPSLVVGPAAGLLTDILPRRRVLIVCDLARVLVILAMCVPGEPIAVLLVLALLASAFEPPFGTARSALMPDVAPGEHFPVATSVASATEQIGQVVGLAAGGAVVSLLSPRGALLIDAATFLLSALFVISHVGDRPAFAEHARGSYWRDTWEGARIVGRQPLLRDLLAVTCIGLALTISVEGLAVPYANQKGAGDVGAGLLAAAWPAGSVVGILAVIKWLPARSRLDGVRLLAVLWPLPLIATALKPPLAVTVVLWAIAGVLTSYVVLMNIIMTQALDPATRGRVISIARALLLGSQGVGLFVTGVVADVLDPASAVALAGVTGMVICPFLAVSLRPAGRHRVSVPGSVPATDGRNLGMPAQSGHGPSVEDIHASTAGGILTADDAAAPTASAAVPGIAPGPVPGAAAEARRRVLGGVQAARLFSLIALTVALLSVSLGGLPPRAHGPVDLTWWGLFGIFLIAELLHVPFGTAGKPILVSLSALPVTLGLLLSTPRDLLIVGALTPYFVQLRRGVTLTRCIVNAASYTLTPVVALAIFNALQTAPTISWSSLTASFLATFGADCTTFLFIVVVRRLLDSSLRWSDVVLTFGYTAIAGLAVSSLGLLAVAAMSARPSYGWLLVFTAFLVVAGTRAYVDLQARHQDLGQLYDFKQQLGPLLPDAVVLAPVLSSALSIMSATTIELAFADDAEHSGRRQRVLSMSLDGELHESWRPPVDLSGRDPSRCLSVPLASGTRRLGTLSVFERQGYVRGFRRTDLRLLETLSGQVADAIERGLLLAQLQDAATHDAMTGLLTLTEFSRLVDEDLLRGDSSVLALIDVARLKDVNDSLGHEAGDALLRTVATRLREGTSPTALLARSGGGEFAVFFPGLRGQRAASAVERLASGLTGLVQVLGVTVDLRTRVGWVTSPRDAQDAANLLRRADLALGAAKRTLQRAMRFSPDLEVDGLRRLRLVNDLREAIERRELTVVYQPLITPRDGLVVGAEALSRWNHGELGPLRPDEFIMVAEQSGLIGQLTEYVLDTALAQARAWEDEGRELKIAVNLSARCLTDLSLPGTVLDLLARHRIDAGRLTLEVTETSVAEDPVRAEAVLSRLRGIGVRLSIDDFGTGYSSLASLKRFPVQEVKLDRQFLVDLEAGLEEGTDDGFDPEQAAVDIALLTAVVTLGHSLQLEIVAEGIETASAYAQLRDLGVDVLQGFFMGRPAAPELLPWRFVFNGTGGSPSVEMWEPPAAEKLKSSQGVR